MMTKKCRAKSFQRCRQLQWDLPDSRARKTEKIGRENEIQNASENIHFLCADTYAIDTERGRGADGGNLMSGAFNIFDPLWAYFFHFPVSFLKNWFMVNSVASVGERGVYRSGGRGQLGGQIEFGQAPATEWNRTVPKLLQKPIKCPTLLLFMWLPLRWGLFVLLSSHSLSLSLSATLLLSLSTLHS